MNRFAIIIESSDVRGQTDLPGARSDAKNWVSFLKSPLGGSWPDGSIKVFNKPTSVEIGAHLTVFKDYYCFVCFSGHGAHSSARGTLVCLNESEQSCSIDRLKPVGSKGTLIVDACRGLEGHRKVRFEKRAATLMLANEANAAIKNRLTSFSASAINTSRWNTMLDEPLTGIVTMYSCSIGEGAGEYSVGDPIQGGFYSLTLVAVADNWNRRTPSGSIYSTKNAHDDTVTYFKEAGIGQNPEYSPMWISYPFAVAT